MLAMCTPLWRLARIVCVWGGGRLSPPNSNRAQGFEFSVENMPTNTNPLAFCVMDCSHTAGEHDDPMCTATLPSSKVLTEESILHCDLPLTKCGVTPQDVRPLDSVLRVRCRFVPANAVPRRTHSRGRLASISFQANSAPDRSTSDLHSSFKPFDSAVREPMTAEHDRGLSGQEHTPAPVIPLRFMVRQCAGVANDDTDNEALGFVASFREPIQISISADWQLHQVHEEVSRVLATHLHSPQAADILLVHVPPQHVSNVHAYTGPFPYYEPNVHRTKRRAVYLWDGAASLRQHFQVNERCLQATRKNKKRDGYSDINELLCYCVHAHTTGSIAPPLQTCLTPRAAALLFLFLFFFHTMVCAGRARKVRSGRISAV